MYLPFLERSSGRKELEASRAETNELNAPPQLLQEFQEKLQLDMETKMREQDCRFEVKQETSRQRMKEEFEERLRHVHLEAQNEILNLQNQIAGKS